MTFSPELERDLRPLSEAAAEMYVASTCFKTGPPGPVGIEIERIVHDPSDPERPVPVAEVRAAAPDSTALPSGGTITIEPGGQLELSSACAPDLPSLLAATRRNLESIDGRLAAAGLGFSPLALDALRPPVRSLDAPRYEAMQQHFDRSGSAGRTMMCSTASLQVCLDAGTAGTSTGSAVRRWSLLHLLAPVLVALFANSPFRHGSPSGWRSTRQGVWLAIDPSRTAPVPVTHDPTAAWARYALDASVLCIPSADGSWSAPRGLTMRQWLRGDGPSPATLENLAYHLTTLFPFVRPRGFLELRVIDAQSGIDWEAATAITTALVDDEEAADHAAAASAPVASLANPMAIAARDGMSEPVLAQAAGACARAAFAALRRSDVDAATLTCVENFIERYPERGRCPADDRLDLWRRTGRLLDRFPSQESPSKEVAR